MSQSNVTFEEITARFEELLERARQTEINEPTAMTLATADQGGRPSSRTVLLKGLDQESFVFYTNFESRKARQLKVNPWASLCFYWDPIREQVLVEGKVEPVSDEESDAYWKTRARQSQIGAWASQQSRPLANRAVLLARVAKYETQFLARKVPRPPHWGGFRLTPRRVEFWTARPHRLHLRILYRKEGAVWKRLYLYP